MSDNKALKDAIWEGLESIGAQIQDLRVHVDGDTVSIQGVLHFDGEEQDE